jgi:hypothetical protein
MDIAIDLPIEEAAFSLREQQIDVISSNSGFIGLAPWLTTERQSRLA